MCERNERLLIVSASSDCSLALWDIYGNRIGVFGQVVELSYMLCLWRPYSFLMLSKYVQLNVDHTKFVTQITKLTICLLQEEHWKIDPYDPHEELEVDEEEQVFTYSTYYFYSHLSFFHHIVYNDINWLTYSFTFTLCSCLFLVMMCFFKDRYISHVQFL